MALLIAVLQFCGRHSGISVRRVIKGDASSGKLEFFFINFGIEILELELGNWNWDFGI
jgi:hypothetical protein